MKGQFYTGAGILPYTTTSLGTVILFQTTHSGKKSHTFLDFGGKRGDEDDPYISACREFAEESYGLFSPEGIEGTAKLGEDFLEEDYIGSMKCRIETERLIQLGMRDICGWTDNEEYCLFFMKVPYIDLMLIQDFFEGGHGKKKRKLTWVEVKKVICRDLKYPLHPRIENIVGLNDLLKKL